MNRPVARRDEDLVAASFDEDVDAIVDAVAADPSCADSAKALLTNKMRAPEMVRVVAPKPAPTKAAVQDDVDDMWDNVPI